LLLMLNIKIRIQINDYTCSWIFTNDQWTFMNILERSFMNDSEGEASGV